MKSGKIALGVRVAVVAGLAMAGTTVVSAGAAHASVSNCKVTYYSDTQSGAECGTLSGLGHYRVTATCYKYGPGPSYVIHGPWEYTAGVWSKANCLTGYYADGAYAETAQ